MAASKFNHLRFLRKVLNNSSPSLDSLKLADFDCRVWNVPSRVEAYNTFVWRNNDAARNSISMVAQSLYSHKELHGMSSSDKQEMLFQKGINWSDYNKSLKNGRLIVREEYRLDNLCGEINLSDGRPSEPMMRTKWVVKPAEKFTQVKGELLSMIPDYA
jgi:tRNA(His) 5'-end guanylyltransferase